MGIIYMLVSPSGKRYIGQTTQRLHKRMAGHHYTAVHSTRSYKSVNAFRKYGIENFKSEILVVCSDEQLDDYEKKCIDLYDTMNNGLNCTAGGGGIRGLRHTEATRKRMSESKTGVKLSEAHCKSLCVPVGNTKNMRKPKSAAHRAAIAAALRGKPKSAAHKANMSTTQLELGKKRRAKLSAAATERHARKRSSGVTCTKKSCVRDI